MKTIMFDKNCAGWSTSVDWNRTFLNVQRNYINDRLMYRGYMYLNDIYEGLGAKWNPENENVCYRAVHGQLSIEYETVGDNAFLVKIYQ